MTTTTTAGSLATSKVTFGESRYAIAGVHTRFGEIAWFVWDAEQPDENGMPDVIRQAMHPGVALHGFRLTRAEMRQVDRIAAKVGVR